MTDGAEEGRPRRATRRISRRPVRVRPQGEAGADLHDDAESLEALDDDLLEDDADPGRQAGDGPVVDEPDDTLDLEPDTDPRMAVNAAPRMAASRDEDKTLPRVPAREAVLAAAGGYEAFDSGASDRPPVAAAVSEPARTEPSVVVRRAHIISDAPPRPTPQGEPPVVVPPARVPDVAVVRAPEAPPSGAHEAPATPAARAPETPTDPRPPTNVPATPFLHSPVPPPVPSAQSPRIPAPPPVPGGISGPISGRASAVAPLPASPLSDASPRVAPLPAPESEAAKASVEVDVVIDDAAELPPPLEDAELERAAIRRSGTPPPPPDSGKAARKPPPPPRAGKPDEPVVQKRARQWWERFFSDDYLMSVLPPTPAQIARQVDFVEASLGIPRGGTVLDVGCGLGLHARELALRGYLVVGLDLSLPMITRAAEDAQQQNLRINFLHTDIREIQFDGAFDAVVCLGTTFGFFDEDSNRDVLARLYQALKPGGRILVDVVNRDYVIRMQPNLVWFQGDGCVCMEESDFNYFTSRLTVKRTMMQEDGQQSDAEYSIRLYSLHELGQLMQQMGFRVMEVSGQEATRGTFFGTHSLRIVMLAERRQLQRMSTVVGAERRTSEAPLPPKREG